MPEYADIYALANQRSEELINRFLDRYMPLREESADEYWIPAYADSPKLILKNDKELIRYCCLHLNEAYGVYWRSKTVDENAHAFFLSDGGLILGLSIPANEYLRVDSASNDLMEFLSTDKVYVTYEDLPPETRNQFDRLFAALPAEPGKEARQTREHRPMKSELRAGESALAER